MLKRLRHGCKGAEAVSLSENFSDYNNILITMNKDAAQH